VDLQYIRQMIFWGNSLGDLLYILRTFQFSDSRWNIIVKIFKRETVKLVLGRWQHCSGIGKKKKKLEKFFFGTKTNTQGIEGWGNVKRILTLSWLVLWSSTCQGANCKNPLCWYNFLQYIWCFFGPVGQGRNKENSIPSGTQNKLSL
jgi:hypothetical protein